MPNHMLKLNTQLKSLLKKKFVIAAIICVLLIVGVGLRYFLSSMSNEKETFYLYIDNDDTADSVTMKLAPHCTPHGMSGFTTILRHSSYEQHVLTGRYAIEPDMCAITVYRRLANGMQAPVHLTIPSVRTLDRLAGAISNKLMLDSTQLVQALTDSVFCKQYGYDTLTIACLFIPNTYDVYWNISLPKFMERMQRENHRFWDGERQQKAQAIGFTPVEVVTLASIVDEETANNNEKPMVAGMYINRLKLRSAEYPNGMPLQADPTIKYAWRQFDLKRIYNKLLNIDSPFNTYRNVGLPPGPIRIPSVAGIDAVLNYTRHQFIYMCANADFSGTHQFAATYSEHLQNARAYAEALNKRGIK